MSIYRIEDVAFTRAPLILCPFWPLPGTLLEAHGRENVDKA